MRRQQSMCTGLAQLLYAGCAKLHACMHAWVLHGCKRMGARPVHARPITLCPGVIAVLLVAHAERWLSGTSSSLACLGRWMDCCISSCTNARSKQAHMLGRCASPRLAGRELRRTCTHAIVPSRARPNAVQEGQG
jgi:hypothetical protein